MSSVPGGDFTSAEIGRILVRLETKLDRSIADHEKRLRTMERWMWMAMGLGGAGAASGIGALLTSGLAQ